MKKFIKPLAFVMAAALTVGSLGVATASAAAAPEFKKSTKTLYVNYDESGKKTGATGYYVNEAGEQVASKSGHTYGLYVLNAKNSGYKFTYSIKDKSIAKIKKSSTKPYKLNIWANTAGKTEITVTVKDKAGKKVGTDTFALVVNSNADKAPVIKEAVDGKLKVGISGAKADGITPAIDLTVDKAELGDTTGSTDKVGYRIVGDANGAEIDATGKIWTTKPATFKVQAYTYQSGHFTGDTQVSDIIEVTADVSLNTVKQTAVDKLKLEFDSKLEASYLAKENLQVYYKLVDDSKVQLVVNTNDIKIDEKTAIIPLYSDLAADVTYYVSYKGAAEIPVKAATTKATDVTDIIMNTKTVVYGEDTTLDYQLVNKDGVDLTKLHKDNLTFEVEASSQNNAYFSGDKFVMPEKDKTATIKLTYALWTVDADNKPFEYKLSKTFPITSKAADPTMLSKHVWSVQQDERTVDLAKDTPVHYVALNDVSSIILLNTYYDNSTTVTKTEANYDLVSADPSVVLIDGNGKLAPVKVGSTSILVYDKEKDPEHKTPIVALAIEVKGNRIPSYVELSQNKYKLNLEGNTYTDKVNVTATVKDNYGQPLKDASITVVPTDINVAKTITVSGTTSKDGQVAFDVEANHFDPSITTTAKTATYKVAATFENVTTGVRTFQVTGKKVADTDPNKVMYKVALGKSTFDTALENAQFAKFADSQVSIGLEGTVDGYTVQDLMTETTSGSALYFNTEQGAKDAIVAGTPAAYYYDIQKNGASIKNNASYNEFFSENGKITPISVSSATGQAITLLNNGVYRVILQKVTKSTTGTTTTTKVSEAVLEVKNSQAPVTVTRKAGNAGYVSSGSEWGNIVNCFDYKFLGEEVIAQPTDQTQFPNDIIVSSKDAYIKYAKITIKPFDTAESTDAKKGAMYTYRFPVNMRVEIQ